VGSGGFQEVEARVAAGVVVVGRGRCDEVPKLGLHLALGCERADDDEDDLEAEVRV
jgi:hypothetical protein